MLAVDILMYIFMLTYKHERKAKLGSSFKVILPSGLLPAMSFSMAATYEGMWLRRGGETLFGGPCLPQRILAGFAR